MEQWDEPDSCPMRIELGLTAISLRELPETDNLLQSRFWGEFKASAGWLPRAFRWTSSRHGGAFLVLERRLPGGPRLAYVPYGPELPPHMENPSLLLSVLARALRPHLAPRCILIRFDLTGGTRGSMREDTAAPPPLSHPLKRTPYRVQPQDSVLLSLEPDENGLLAGMHKKTRYNIRLAIKKGVSVQRHSGEAALKVLPAWYALYQETGRRDRISLHSQSYYRSFIKLAAQEKGGPRVSLYTAHHDDDMQAGIIVSHMGRRATYMYGASANRKRELMPNHLLQWRAIQDARSEGCKEYDFFGVPPREDPSHPLYGLWRFKTGFGGDIAHYLGAWDYAYSPLLFSAYRALETIRAWWTVRQKNPPHRRQTRPHAAQ